MNSGEKLDRKEGADATTHWGRRSLALLLTAVTPLYSMAAEGLRAAAPIKIIAANPRPITNSNAYLWVLRSGRMANQDVKVSWWPGAMLTCRDGKRVGPSTSSTSEVVLDSRSPNPSLLCVSTSQPASMRLLAVGQDLDGLTYVESSENIQFVNASELPQWWESAGAKTVLSAAVGFLFGLGANIFSTWFDGWKSKRTVRLNGEQTLISTVYPELMGHAQRLRELDAIADRLDDYHALLLQPLRQRGLTTALFEGQAASVKSYLGSIGSTSRPLRRLTAYDELIQSFNNEVIQLVQTPTDQRNFENCEKLVKRIESALLTFGVAK